MTLKEQLTSTMEELSRNDKVIFLGEGLIDASPIYGTMINVPKNKVIEMPIAENLIVGASIGLALEGYIPVVVFQRMDFMLCAADAIINHLCLMPKMSGGRITLPVIIRTVVGSQDIKKFNVGMQHSKDLTYIFSPYINTITLKPEYNVKELYLKQLEHPEPVMIVEWKDDYEK